MAQAIRFHQTGGPEVLELETVEVGEPGPGQVARAPQLRRGELHRHLLPHRPLPDGAAERPGLATPSASSKPSAKASPTSRPATASAICSGRRARTPTCALMPADVLIPLPAGVSDRTASTLMMKGMTAQYLFRQVFPLQGGETILYHAAAGGVGLVACQWARAIGVTMIGTVSTDAKAEVARAHGCTHTIVTGGMTRGPDARDQAVREITGGKGVPVVYDSVGKDTLMASLDSLQVRGTLVSNGTTLRSGGHRHHAARGQGLDLAHAAGDGALRHAALADAGDGRRAVRPRAGRPHRRRAQAAASRSPTPPTRTARSSRARPPAPPCWCPEGTAMDLHALEQRRRRGRLPVRPRRRPGSPSR